VSLVRYLGYLRLGTNIFFMNAAPIGGLQRRNSMQYARMADEGPHCPTNTTTMVEPFSGPTAWPQKTS
jgi:hypothetical protein